jgi:hypothetical protein
VSVESIVKCASFVEKFPRIIARDWRALPELRL